MPAPDNKPQPKVAIIGCQGIPVRYGGFEMLTENLAKHLSKRFALTVYCSTKAYKTRRPSYLGAKLKFIPLNANGAQSIPYDIWSMIGASRYADILLILGVSGCIFLPILKLLTRKTIIVNLDGIEWKRAKWGWFARNFLHFSEFIATRWADVLIADNKAISDYIRDTYKRDSFLIEYGGDNALVDLPVKENPDLSVLAIHRSNADKQSQTIPFARYAFSVCRIEPENNIDIIIEAFDDLSPVPLVIVGNWDASDYGREIKARYGDRQNVCLLDPVWDSEELFALRSGAAIYLHGHSAGGTNPSLVEAMALGLPVVAFDVVFNRATTMEQAVYFDSAATLRELVRTMSQDDLRKLGSRMLAVAKDRYTWGRITAKYAELFDEASGTKVGRSLFREEEQAADNATESKASGQPAKFVD